MIKLVVVFLIAACSFSNGAVNKLKPTDKLKDGQPLVDHINSIPGNSWKAHLTFHPETTVGDFVRSRLGLKELVKNNAEHQSKQSERNYQNDNDNLKLENLPESFDLREKYPNCISVSSVKDQSNCGSCWAVSVASVLSDRFCIQSNGKIAYNLSANYLTACSKQNYGCRGGYFDRSYDFIKKHGLVTGGDFESDEGCQPYEVMPCGFPDLLPCSSDETLTPKCKSKACTNEYYHADYEEKTYKISNYTVLPKNETLIRHAIYKNGPVTAGFVVYQDFMFYQKGIYEKRSWWPAGRHAVKIIGWGVENGKKYWTVANSWSRRWGENGYFRIIRGRNECEFEANVIDAKPLIE